MGGKRLKFPTRGKFVDTSKDVKFEDKERDSIDEEAHKKRLELLKGMGILK